MDRWAVVALATAVLIAGCTTGNDDPQRFTTWPDMGMEVTGVVVGAEKSCPAPWHHIGVPCRDVAVDVILHNLDPDLPVHLDDVWIVADLTTGDKASPGETPGAPSWLGPEREELITYTWTLPTDRTVAELTLEHVRLYQDSRGTVPVRVLAEASVPEHG